MIVISKNVFKKVKDALEFYGSESSHDEKHRDVINGNYYESDVMIDSGAIASEVLKELDMYGDIPKILIVKGRSVCAAEETIYVGVDWKKAFDTKLNDNLALTIDVWVNNINVKSFIKEDTYDWKVVYDKQNEIENEIEKYRDKLKVLEEELNSIKH